GAADEDESWWPDVRRVPEHIRALMRERHYLGCSLPLFFKQPLTHWTLDSTIGRCHNRGVPWNGAERPPPTHRRRHGPAAQDVRSFPGRLTTPPAEGGTTLGTTGGYEWKKTIACLRDHATSRREVRPAADRSNGASDIRATM